MLYFGRYFATPANCAALRVDPRLEVGGADDAAGVEHVAVPEPAELGAADLERADLRRLDVGDVVDARVRVRLDAELVRPERVDRVERRDVERDLLADGQHELGRLDAAVGRVAVGELPLLADHLHRQHGAARLRDRVRARCRCRRRCRRAAPSSRRSRGRARRPWSSRARRSATACGRGSARRRAARSRPSAHGTPRSHSRGRRG